MKNFKRTGKVLLTVMMLFIIAAGMTLTAHARKLPSKIRSYPGSYTTLHLELNRAEYAKITSAKGLKYKVDYETWSTDNDSDYNDDSTSDFYLYTKKKGTYTVKYDIYSAVNNAKVASGTTKVFVRDDSAIKKVTVNGKEWIDFQSYMTTKKSVKFKVTMNKGYKLKKLEVGTYGAPKTEKEDDSNYSKSTTVRNEMTYKKFKNGGKVTLASRGYYYLHDYNYLDPYDNGKDAYKSHHLSQDLPRTEIRVTYIDKYTKQETTTYYSFTKWG